MEALKHVAPLFEAIKHVKTATGLTWDVATSVRTKEGKVTIATGQDSTYKELETPTKVHGLVGACFSRMWMEPSLAKHFPTYEEFNLVATTISTVCNEAAKTAGDADAEAFADSSWHGASQTNEDRSQQRRQGRQSVPGADHPRGCGILHTICFVQL